MSRIGKLPIPIPPKVEVDIDDTTVRVKGPLGALERTFVGVSFAREGEAIHVSRIDESRQSSAMWGLGRTLLSNMVVGVSQGFTKSLVIEGVGYRVEHKGSSVLLSLGFSHQIDFPLPEGIEAKVDKNTSIEIKGISKELVGQTAAKIRELRPPEPYKGKGVRYANEIIRRKAGKAAK